jgi:hypothetical protein
MPNITITEYNTLLKIKARFEEMREDQAMLPFIKQFSENLAMLAAYKTLDKWPVEFVDSFRAAQKLYPHAAQLYLERMNKIHQTRHKRI